MTDFGLIFLILVATAAVFFLGRRSAQIPTKSKNPSYSSWHRKTNVEGLTFLFNEQADEAIDSFIADMEINDNTLELHLALGKMLRGKGELGRAVRVHENILAYESLSEDNKPKVSLELAKDYFDSGLLDRAENTLKKILQSKRLPKELRKDVLVNLTYIYSDLKEWLTAIDIADQLTATKFLMLADQWRQAQSHYSCELAEEALIKKDDTQSRHWIKTALKYDPSCVRATLLQAQIEMLDEKYLAAIAVLKNIPEQSAELATEMIPPLVECYKKIGAVDAMLDDVTKYLEKYSDQRALWELYKVAEKEKGKKFVIASLLRVLPNFPSLKPAEEIVQALNQDLGSNTSNYEKFKSAIEASLQFDVHYECNRCGFTGENIHWMCPSCRRWGQMRMIM